MPPGGELTSPPLTPGGDDSDGSDNEAHGTVELPEGKVGKKKLAKLEAKAEKKAQREVRGWRAPLAMNETTGRSEESVELADVTEMRFFFFCYIFV